MAGIRHVTALRLWSVTGRGGTGERERNVVLRGVGGDVEGRDGSAAAELLHAGPVDRPGGQSVGEGLLCGGVDGAVE